MRATETAHPDRLFDDPYAQRFVDAAPEAFEGLREGSASFDDLGPLAEPFYTQSVLRTRFFDDHLQAAARRGCRQVVLLAAGLDTRAFRLPWPGGVELYELDTPDLMEFKAHHLDAAGARVRCRRAVVAVDLRHDWPAALVAAGFDPARPTAWLVEGLLIYLTPGEAERVLADVTRLSAPGSEVAMEDASGLDPDLAALVRATPAMAEVAVLWRGGLGRPVAGWLADHGWEPAVHDLATVAAGLGRAEGAAGRVGVFVCGRRAGASPGPAPSRARYLVVERFTHGPGPVYQRAARQGRLLPEGLHHLDSWVVDDGRMDRCFELIETDDRSLFDTWAARWADLGEIEVLPVITSAEAAARVGVDWTGRES